MKKLVVFIILAGFIGLSVFAQVEDPVQWKFTGKAISEDTYMVSFQADIDKGWHMYGLHIAEGGPLPLSFRFENEKNIEFKDQMSSVPKPVIQYDSIFEMNVELFEHKVVFSQKIKVRKNSKAIIGTITFMVCDNSRCLPPKDVDFNLTLKPYAGTEINAQKNPDAQQQNEIGSDSGSEHTAIGSLKDTVNNESDTVGQLSATHGTTGTNDQTPLWILFLRALAAGLGAILTPCVYPIIPLTISFFMRDVSRSRGVFNGLFFGISIVLIYTSIGLLAGLLHIDLIRLISSHWLPNLIFFIVFLTLAASFFGLFEITLPGSLSTRIDKQADKGGYLAPFFMALATVVVSFSCTGPIVGWVLGTALQGELLEPVFVMFGFSLTFALPFTLLAIFPAYMNKLPKSGGWLNSVKVFFAFLLLAFSLIFLPNMGLKNISRDLVLALAIVIFILLGVYLLGKIRFAHDQEVKHISFFRLLLAIAAFSFAVYMIPGLFGSRLKVLEPFLPAGAETINSIASKQNTGSDPGISQAVSVCGVTPKYSGFLTMPLGLNGFFDYDEALNCARQMNKPLLLDFAGHGCKNCKKMYAEVWSDTAVYRLLQNEFVIAVLYTDDRTDLPEKEWYTSPIDGKTKNTLGKKFNDLQIRKFTSNALPLYAIVDGNGNIITQEKYKGYDPDIAVFLQFLKEGIGNYKNR